MVSNVAYGRTIYVKLETTSKSKDVQALLKPYLRITVLKQVDSIKIFLKKVPLLL